MKKNMIISLIILIVCCFILTGCQQVDPKEKMINNLSEVRKNCWSCETNKGYSTFMTGEREETYNIDGIHTKNKEFGVISVTFKTTNSVNLAPTYTLTVNEDTFEGALEKNPYSNCYMADVGKAFDSNSNITLTVKFEDFEETFNLTSVSDNFKISWEKALEIANENMQQRITEVFGKKGLGGESYLRIINGEGVNFNSYYWYFSIVDKKEQTSTIIINTETGEVLAKK